MFIRIKGIKGKKYAYLVENNWQRIEDRWQIVEIEPQIIPFSYHTNIEKSKKKKSSRQKVVGYLGRVHEFEISQKEYSRKLESNYRESIHNIVQWHLEQYGFKKKGNLMINKDIGVSYHPEEIELKNKKTDSNTVIKSFDGYICSHTLKKLYEFDGLGYDEEVGKRLANTLVKAGMNVSKETFIALFERVFRGER